MSPRAAWRLEILGFGEVYDYVEGKVDWLAAGLSTEGRQSQRPRAGGVARRDAPTCELEDSVGGVRDKIAPADVCVVVNPQGVVLGLLRSEQLAASDDTRVSDAMRPGPSTFRPHVPIKEMAEYMTRHDLASAPITTSDGRLVGVLFRDDAVRAAEEAE